MRKLATHSRDTYTLHFIMRVFDDCPNRAARTEIYYFRNIFASAVVVYQLIDH